MREDIIFAGFGGQGIMFMGKILSYAAMQNGKFFTWMPSYGAEVRGGTAHSMVIISDISIASPVVKEPTICVVMNMPSFQKFESKVKPRGMLIVNKSLVKTRVGRKDLDILEIPATDIAAEIGSPRVGNMVILGALLARKQILSVKSLEDSLGDIFPESNMDLIAMNKQAIAKGYEYGSREIRS